MCFGDSRTKMNAKVGGSMESKPFFVAAISDFSHGEYQKVSGLSRICRVRMLSY